MGKKIKETKSSRSWSPSRQLRRPRASVLLPSDGLHALHPLQIFVRRTRDHALAIVIQRLKALDQVLHARGTALPRNCPWNILRLGRRKVMQFHKSLRFNFLLRDARRLRRQGCVLQFDKFLWMGDLLRCPLRGRADRSAGFSKNVRRGRRESRKSRWVLTN